MSANLCACRCGGRVSKPRTNKGKRGKAKYISGHNQFRTELVGRSLAVHNARRDSGRIPPKVKLFDGKRPSSLSRVRPHE